jgi:hypothetical protein
LQNVIKRMKVENTIILWKRDDLKNKIKYIYLFICCKHKILFWILNLEICNFDENNQVVNSLRI